jgi:hypothetical protein
VSTLARVLPAVALVATVALSGCSSSGGSPKASGGSGTSGSTAPLTSPPASPSTTVSTTASALPTGHSGSSFCEDARVEKSQENAEIAALTKDTPAEMAQYVTKELGDFGAFIAAAPASIKGDLQTAYTYTKTFFAELKAANYDYSKLTPSETTSLTNPKFTAANKAIANYLQTACGIVPTDTAS